jgi:hypothetical protein
MPTAARVYIDGVIAVGLAVAGYALIHWESQNPIRFLMFLALFILAALLKGRIPGITGTYSPVFFFVLLGSHELSFSEVVFATALAGIVQCSFFVQRRPFSLQIAFNAANMTICAACAFVFIHREAPLTQALLLVLLILGTAMYYVVNTGLVAMVVTLVDSKPLKEVWRHWCLGSLAYYILGALIACATLSTQNQLSMRVLGMVCPSLLLITVYYRYWLKSKSRVNTPSR